MFMTMHSVAAQFEMSLSKSSKIYARKFPMCASSKQWPARVDVELRPDPRLEILELA
jgi:hypothetical protein